MRNQNWMKKQKEFEILDKNKQKSELSKEKIKREMQNHYVLK